MSTSGKTIARNAGVMMATQLVTWALALLIAIFQPRYLGATATGELSIAFSVWLITGVLMTFGMDTHLMKSLARAPERTSQLVGTSVLIRCVLFLLGFVVVTAYLKLMHYEPSVITIANLVGVSILFTVVGGAFAAALTGLELMGSVSIATVASKLVLTVVTLSLLFLGFDVYWVAGGNIVSTFVSMVLLAYFLHRRHPLHFSVDVPAGLAMMRVSSPYMVTALTLMLYQQVDKLFIAGMASTEAVGWYSTAMNLFGTLMFIPVAMGTVLFPTLSRSYAAGQSQLASVARRSFDLMFIMSVPIGLGLSVVARPLVLMLFGPEFAPSGSVLSILGIVLIFTYLNTILGQLLISAERTGPWNWVMIAAIVLTLPLDLVLIPWTEQIFGNGALGGALSFLLTELLMICCAILLLPRRTLHWGNVRTVLLTMLAGVAMMGVSWVLLDRNMFLAIAAGGVVYPVVVLALRIVPREDLALIRESVAGVFERLRPRATGAQRVSEQTPAEERIVP